MASAYDDMVAAMDKATSGTAAPTTDAKSGATLDGASWLSNLLKTGIAGYVAVQTVKNQNRTGDSVTTRDIPRVEETRPLGESGPTMQTIVLVGGIILSFGLLTLLFRGRK